MLIGVIFPAVRQRAAVLALERDDIPYELNGHGPCDGKGLVYKGYVPDAIENTPLMDLFVPVRYAWLSGGQIDDDSLKQLRYLPRLQGLCVASDKVTDNGLQVLAHLKSLEWLKLRDCPVTDKALPQIAQLNGIRSVTLLDTEITTDGVRWLKAQLPDCKIYYANDRIRMQLIK